MKLKFSIILTILMVLVTNSSVIAESTITKSYKIRITIPQAVGSLTPLPQNSGISSTNAVPFITGGVIVEETTRGSEKIVLQSMVVK